VRAGGVATDVRVVVDKESHIVVERRSESIARAGLLTLLFLVRVRGNRLVLLVLVRKRDVSGGSFSGGLFLGGVFPDDEVLSGGTVGSQDLGTVVGERARGGIDAGLLLSRVRDGGSRRRRGSVGIFSQLLFQFFHHAIAVTFVEANDGDGREGLRRACARRICQ
jgi:hypothetical protein